MMEWLIDAISWWWSWQANLLPEGKLLLLLQRESDLGDWD